MKEKKNSPPMPLEVTNWDEDTGYGNAKKELKRRKEE